MTALRAALLLLAMVLVAIAAGAAALEPSAQRVVVSAVACFLLPVFWPGEGATAVRTSLRVVAWPTLAALGAAAVLLTLGGERPLSRLFAACAMLWLIGSAALACTALFERVLRRRSLGGSATASAGALGALLLALAGALPLWLGPAAELVAPAWPWAVDAVVGASPLTAFALASGNDLLRNGWLYAHANVAMLTVAYPDLRLLALAYLSILSLLLAAVAWWSCRAGHGGRRSSTQMEDSR